MRGRGAAGRGGGRCACISVRSARASGAGFGVAAAIMVLESVVAELLNRFLGAYVENLNKSQLKLGIWGGRSCSFSPPLLSPRRAPVGSLGRGCPPLTDRGGSFVGLAHAPPLPPRTAGAEPCPPPGGEGAAGGLALEPMWCPQPETRVDGPYPQARAGASCLIIVPDPPCTPSMPGCSSFVSRGLAAGLTAPSLCLAGNVALDNLQIKENALVSVPTALGLLTFLRAPLAPLPLGHGASCSSLGH